MKKDRPGSDLLSKQAELRASGLLAGPGDRWHHPSGAFYLEALPGFANRRQRSDRPTKFQTEKVKSKRGRAKR